jgi:hypothetical protein
MNLWNLFQHEHKGQGLSSTVLSKIFRGKKSKWLWDAWSLIQAQIKKCLGVGLSNRGSLMEHLRHSLIYRHFCVRLKQKVCLVSSWENVPPKLVQHTRDHKSPDFFWQLDICPIRNTEFRRVCYN